MSFWDILSSLFRSSDTPRRDVRLSPSNPQTLAALFTHIFALFSDSTRITSVQKQYSHIGSVPSEEKEREYIRLYVTLEQLVVTSKPPSVQKEFSVASLREYLGTKVQAHDLGTHIGLLFLPVNMQAVTFLRLGLDDVCLFITGSLGLSRLREITARAVEGTPIEPMEVSELGISFPSAVDADFSKWSYSQILSAYRALYSACFEEITSSVGSASAIEIFSRYLKFVQSVYPQDFVGLLLDVLPTGEFEAERTLYTSREDLERQVQERTREVQTAQKTLEDKLLTIEAKNKESEDNKRAMLNLLDDAKALEEELIAQKASVEAKVNDRTRELSEEKAKLTASINSLEIGFTLVDSNGKIVTINSAMRHILGIEKEVQNISEIEEYLAHQVNIVGYQDKTKKEAKSQRIPDVTIGTKHIDLFIAPIFLDRDKTEFLGNVILITDISDAKALERSRDEFFSIASHELRTPLTAIRGNTALIKEYYIESLKDPQLVEMVDDIHQSSVRLIDIVNDFLDVGRLEQNRMVFHNEGVDISVLVDSTLKEYQVTGSRRNLHITAERPSEPLPGVFGDKDKLRQVLINLIGNAVKFTITGGVTIRFRGKGDFVEVEVADTGRGIPYENQSLLFRKFTQAGDSIFTRDTTKGTGLGLYISKLIIEGMGGTIRLVRSVPEKGSAFAFTVPVARDNNNPPVKLGEHLGDQAVGLLPPHEGV